MEDEVQLLTVEELAERLNVRKSWVYRQTSLLRISPIKVGKYNRYDWNQVIQDLEKLKGGENRKR